MTAECRIRNRSNHLTYNSIHESVVFVVSLCSAGINREYIIDYIRTDFLAIPVHVDTRSQVLDSFPLIVRSESACPGFPYAEKSQEEADAVFPMGI